MILSNIAATLIAVSSLAAFTIPPNSQNWTSNYQEALAKANSESKNVLMVFSGSDWCANCMRLESSVFNTQHFQEYASENLVLLKLDFPLRKKNKLSEELTKQNEQLAERFNKAGAFPTVVILSAAEQELGRTGYKPVGPEAYIGHLQGLLK